MAIPHDNGNRPTDSWLAALLRDREADRRMRLRLVSGGKVSRLGGGGSGAAGNPVEVDTSVPSANTTPLASSGAPRGLRPVVIEDGCVLTLNPWTPRD